MGADKLTMPFGSFARKRYRFTGKERDEESGLSYHGARYYAPWLARWTIPDPAGHTDQLNLYTYARSRPSSLTDPSGNEDIDPQQATGVSTTPTSNGGRAFGPPTEEEARTQR